jgi:hypothetical protein
MERKDFENSMHIIFTVVRMDDIDIAMYASGVACWIEKNILLEKDFTTENLSLRDFTTENLCSENVSEIIDFLKLFMYIHLPKNQKSMDYLKKNFPSDLFEGNIATILSAIKKIEFQEKNLSYSFPNKETDNFLDRINYLEKIYSYERFYGTDITKWKIDEEEDDKDFIEREKEFRKNSPNFSEETDKECLFYFNLLQKEIQRLVSLFENFSLEEKENSGIDKTGFFSGIRQIIKKQIERFEVKNSIL